MKKLLVLLSIFSLLNFEKINSATKSDAVETEENTGPNQETVDVVELEDGRIVAIIDGTTRMWIPIKVKENGKWVLKYIPK